MRCERTGRGFEPPRRRRTPKEISSCLAFLGASAVRSLFLASLIGSAGSAVFADRVQAQSDAGAAVEKLPAEHEPRVALEIKPSSVSTGDIVHVSVRADALEGDDVTLPEQSFAPFELTNKRPRVEPSKNGRRLFVFELDLLALDPGKHALPGLELRVVTKDGFVGATRSGPIAVEVKSLLGNEPNAQLKPETKPVVVMQDDYTLLWILGALAAAGLVALLTWLLTRYLQRRQRPLPPPPPPRPPWEIAVERLAALRKRKQTMIEEGRAAQFVDEVSDVVRAYLGGLFEFDGLETTTDEMLELLRTRNANAGLWQEVAAYLRRCDLVKFAKVEPDQDEADLVFAKAQDIVQFSMPLGAGYPGNPAGPAGPGKPAGGSRAPAEPNTPAQSRPPSGPPPGPPRPPTDDGSAQP